MAYMTVRELIEHLAQYDGDLLIATRQFQHGTDTVTLRYLEQDEVDLDEVLHLTSSTQMVVLG
jgi:hypothetical protein